MFQGIAVHLVVMFVMSQVQELGQDTDFSKIEAKMDQQIEAAVKSKWLASKLEATANVVYERAVVVLSKTDALASLVTAIANKQWHEAADDLKALILSGWSPSDALAQEAIGLLQGAAFGAGAKTAA